MAKFGALIIGIELNLYHILSGVTILESLRLSSWDKMRHTLRM